MHQLCLPQCRTVPVIKLAHESVFSGHFSSERTLLSVLARIALVFYWPGMRQQCVNFVKACHPCQLSRRKTVYDDVEFTPLYTACKKFEALYTDIIGPIAMVNSQQPKFVLITVDSFSRMLDAEVINNTQSTTICRGIVENILTH